ncbi:MAG: GNAT family N-acetyltransferase [Chloroflexota bacterium]
MLPSFTLRPAQLADIEEIARVQVETWRTTYKGIMPDELLANLTVESRLEIWRGPLSNPDSPSIIYVAEADGQIIGFAAGGPERSGHALYKVEIYAIYLLQAYQGRGIGRALMQAVVGRLIDKGFTAMLIWVAAKNPATHFYAALGGQPFASKTESFGGGEVEEIAYGYDDISKILADSK